MVNAHDDVCSCSDEDVLVKAALAGDGDAWNVLFDKYFQLLVFVVSGFERDRDRVLDVVQETFMSAFRQRSKFRGDCSFKTWLTAIARFQSSNAVRYHKRRKTESLAGLEGSDGPTSNDDPVSTAVRSEESLEVKRGLESLAAISHDILVARYYGDLSEKEMADLFSVPVTSIKSRLHFARKKLREVLAEVA
jgi:RNA polymerase sigma-70 factor (ECF subfamily)